MSGRISFRSCTQPFDYATHFTTLTRTLLILGIALRLAKGLVLVGGGEPENYDILGEKELRPIVNVLPDEADVYNKLEQMALHSDEIAKLSADSRL